MSKNNAEQGYKRCGWAEDKKRQREILDYIHQHWLVQSRLWNIHSVLDCNPFMIFQEPYSSRLGLHQGFFLDISPRIILPPLTAAVPCLFLTSLEDLLLPMTMSSPSRAFIEPCVIIARSMAISASA